MLKREWLDQVHEPVIEPELEIVDPHHHLWPQPLRRYPVYDLADLRQDTGAGHNVVQTVFIDCAASYRTEGPEELRPVGETEWVASRAEESDRTPGAKIAAIVSFADMTLGEGAEEVLQAHAQAGGGRFRGIRHAGAWDPDPRIARSHTNPPPDLYRLASFNRGLDVLARLGMVFEAWQYHTQLHEVAALARAHPDLSIVLNHLGAPLGIGPYEGRRDEVLAVWKPAMSELAGIGNVSLKLGGIGMARYGMRFEERDKPATSDELVATWGDQVRWCIDAFSPQRCMFESNFPVDSESCSYTVLWNSFKKMSSRYSATERAAMFSGTARRVYGIAP